MNITHGMKYTREYQIWSGMKKRCLSTKAVNYSQYGGRGIYVCEKWMSFEGFFEDMGYSNGLCLDRIDNNKGYDLSNCRWVTHKENNRNKSNNVLIEGKTMTEWSEITGISRNVIWYRLRKLNMNPMDAVTMPLMRKKGKHNERSRLFVSATHGGTRAHS